jgi:hypothetical protein
MGASGDEAPGDAIGTVLEALGDTEDELARFGVDTVFAVESARYGGDVDAGFAGDVFDGYGHESI